MEARVTDVAMSLDATKGIGRLTTAKASPIHAIQRVAGAQLRASAQVSSPPIAKGIRVAEMTMNQATS